MLQRQGHAPPTVIAAVFAWPAMVGVLGEVRGDRSVGPFQHRIEEAFTALRASLNEPRVVGVADVTPLATIEAALVRADGRILAVDRLLADASVAADPDAARLRAARDRAAVEVESVLSQLVHVRVQLGLVALAGDTSSVRAHIGELAARARALEEVTSG